MHSQIGTSATAVDPTIVRCCGFRDADADVNADEHVVFLFSIFATSGVDSEIGVSR